MPLLRPGLPPVTSLTYPLTTGTVGAVAQDLQGYMLSGKTKNKEGKTLTDMAKANQKWDDTFRCKHIKAVRRYFGEELVTAFLRERHKLQPKTDEL